MTAAIPDRDGTRRSFSGSREDIAGDIRSFAAIGVHELILDFRGESIAESIARLQRFAAEVMPLVGGHPSLILHEEIGSRWIIPFRPRH